jgi:hypothetical protein
VQRQRQRRDAGANLLHQQKREGQPAKFAQSCIPDIQRHIFAKRNMLIQLSPSSLHITGHGHAQCAKSSLIRKYLLV